MDNIVNFNDPKPARPIKRIHVKVQGDHLEALAKCSPVKALAELIWNALDADASNVAVLYEQNLLTGIDRVIVSDDGSGITPPEAERVFENLGGSWKREKRRTSRNRVMHGQHGEGRFRAFALGIQVTWESYALHEGRLVGTAISGQASSSTFSINELTERKDATGTSVRVVVAGKPIGALLGAEAEHRLTQEFALYLRHYPDVNITVDGRRINPNALQDHTRDYNLGEIEVEQGRSVPVALTVIEWKSKTERAIMLCDEAGFPVHEVEPRIQAPGFHFTAYLSSPYVREIQEQNLLEISGLHSGLNTLLDAARARLRDHFRKRASDRAISAIQRWKADEIYPYQGSPSDPLEEAERQVFDICALEVVDNLPDFDETNKKQRKLAFRLLREAIEMNPSSLKAILVEVLGLTPSKQDDLAKLLQQTTLSAIINASKVVSDRLEFLKGLEHLIYDSENNKRLLERTQLHRILAENTWLFGEEYHLSVDDESLTTVLERHLELFDKSNPENRPVLRLDGSKGIVDLMFSRATKQPDPLKREHLVVELKRPSQQVDVNVLNQIQSYALAVAQDSRFDKQDTRWKFIAVSTKLDAFATSMAEQENRPAGCVFIGKHSLTVWALTWGQIIDRARARLEFFKEKLEYSATQDTSLAHLRQVYSQYLPDHLSSSAQEPVVSQATEKAISKARKRTAKRK